MGKTHGTLPPDYLDYGLSRLGQAAVQQRAYNDQELADFRNQQSHAIAQREAMRNLQLPQHWLDRPSPPKKATLRQELQWETDKWLSKALKD